MNKIRTVFTTEAPEAIGPYSQGKSIAGFLFLSGQIPLDHATGEISGNSIEEQTEQVMKNIIEVLKAEGATMENAVKTTCFLSDMNNFAAFNDVYAKYFTTNPARSCVEVKRLPKDVLVEVEVIAHTCS